MLGSTVLVVQIALQAFGSTFWKNCQVLGGFGVGYLAAAILTYPSPHTPHSQLHYVVSAGRHASRPGTQLTCFTGTKVQILTPDASLVAITLPLFSPSSYPLSVCAELIVPLLTCFVITTVETVGGTQFTCFTGTNVQILTQLRPDVAATVEASKLTGNDREVQRRIQGGVLADGVSSFLSCALTSLPTTTMSQNNGVVVMTRCASRRVGYACGGWLLVFGLFSDLSAYMTSVPNCVLGGMMSMLFAQIVVSGIRLLRDTRCSIYLLY